MAHYVIPRLLLTFFGGSAFITTRYQQPFFLNFSHSAKTFGYTPLNWFQKLLPERIRTKSNGIQSQIPEGLWSKCPQCNAVLYRTEMERSFDVCPKCDHHTRQSARRRLMLFLDPEPQTEIGAAVEPVDVLRFEGAKKYADQLIADRKTSGENDAMVVIMGRLKGIVVVVAAFEYGFRAGSMGSVVGERFVRGVDTAVKYQIPLVCFSCSGGARMQEGLLALMQMAKTSAALARLRRHRLPYISVLTDPTSGGVSASLGMLGDINIAEPNALICFTGPRVIEQTIKQKLPENFQRSEFLLQHGAIDLIIDRRQQRNRIASLLALLTNQPLP